MFATQLLFDHLVYIMYKLPKTSAERSYITKSKCERHIHVHLMPSVTLLLTLGTKELSWLGVGLVIRGSLVQFPAGALWSVLGQDNLFHIASVYPARKWVPSINKAVLRACALYAASCSRISPGGGGGD